MADWSLVNSWTFSTNVANVDFTGLAGYTDVRVLIRGITLSVSGRRALRVSTDNGSTFLSTSGDYVFVDGTGAETNATNITGHTTDTTAARSCEIEINGFDLTTLKVAQCSTRTDFRLVIIPTSSALNAVRVLGSNGGNLTAGSIYVYAR
jgi:hypothetical protein